MEIPPGKKNSAIKNVLNRKLKIFYLTRYNILFIGKRIYGHI